MTTVLPVVPTTVILLRFVAIPVTDTVTIEFAELTEVTSAVHCTDTIVEKSAVPPEVPSVVGIMVACPVLELVTTTVPNQFLTLTKEAGVPDAAVE